MRKPTEAHKDRWISYRRLVLDKDLEDAKRFMKGIVLDIGGGRKRGTFTNPRNATWITLDLEKSFHPHVIGDATKLPIESNCIDCVKCTELLEHIEYPEKALEEILRVLKPQGFLVLSAPFLAEIHGDPDDFFRFTDQFFEKKLQKEFRICVLKKQGYYFTVLAYIVQRGIVKSTRFSRLLYCLFPLLDVMIRLDDRAFVKDSRFLTSFTTGVFAVAQKKGIRWDAFKFKYQLPPSFKLNPWAMDAEDLEAIVDIIHGYRNQKNILIAELGSGLSTVVLATILQKRIKAGRIVSIEGEKKCAEQLQDTLEKQNLDSVVDSYFVPYVERDKFRWFDTEKLRQILRGKRADILIVDAPPGISCPFARQPAIPFFLPHLNKNATVVLHDAYRPDESYITKIWSPYFRSSSTIKTARGLAVFEGLQSSTLRIT